MARVRLATTERMFDRQANETKEHTEWHTITLWRGLADVVDRYVRKGSQIYVEGRLRTREWTDKDGNKRYTTEILADTMNLLGRRGDNNAVPDGGYGQQQGGGQYGQSSNGGSNYGGVPQGLWRSCAGWLSITSSDYSADCGFIDIFGTAVFSAARTNTPPLLRLRPKIPMTCRSDASAGFE